MIDQSGRHQAVIPASAHDPAQIATELAALVGQVQHLIDLAELSVGRNVYDPLVVDLSAGTSQTIFLPSEAHQIETVQVSSDTAATIQLYRIDQYSGTSGKLIGQIYTIAGATGVPLQLNCPIPPTSCQLKIVTSVAIAHGAAVVVLARSRSGGFPYAS